MTDWLLCYFKEGVCVCVCVCVAGVTSRRMRGKSWKVNNEQVSTRKDTDMFYFKLVSYIRLNWAKSLENFSNDMVKLVRI
jgi:hypothetical protein